MAKQQHYVLHGFEDMHLIFGGCYHKYEGNALNVVDIELTGSVINNTVVYIIFRKLVLSP